MRNGGEDGAIDRVLAGLRAAEPAPEMRARLLERLATAQREVSQDESGRGLVAGRHRWTTWWMLPRVAWAAALVATVIAGVVWYGKGHGVGTGAVRVAGVSHGAAARRRAGASPAMAGAATVVAGRERTGGTHADVARHATPHAAVVPGRWEAGSLVGSSVGSSAGRGGRTRAVTAVEAVSFPAPPMPLTRQERLLQGMLRGGGGMTELVATLRPGAETAVRLEEKAEFSRFFRPAAAGGGERVKDTGLDLEAGTTEAAVGAPRAATENSGGAGR